MTTRYSVSDTLSIASQPAMHAFRTSGSFSPLHTSACGTGISCSPVISMGFPFLYVAHRASSGRTAILARCSGKMTPMDASLSQPAWRIGPSAAVLVALLLGGPDALAQSWPAKAGPEAIHRLCEEGTRQARLRFPGQRHARASDRGAVETGRRNRDDPRSLQGREPCSRRPDRGPCARDLHDADDCSDADQGGPCACARGELGE